MLTDVQIINLGLSKIGSSRISRIDPPQSSLERFCSDGYPHWKRTEISKRRWTFATEYRYALALTDTLLDDERPYVYQLPTDCVRIIRESRSEWVQRKRSIYSGQEGLRVNYLANVPETEFDPLFAECLACRVAQECVEYVTQSNTKKADTNVLYKDALAAAAQANAFVIGPEDIGADDEDFPFLTGRF
jgi:hypothetical protein